MASRTIFDIMAFFQGEKTVVNGLCTPIRIIQAMALQTIGREPRFFMIGIGSVVKIIKMAGNTVVTNSIKTNSSFRSMALRTANCCMHA